MTMEVKSDSRPSNIEPASGASPVPVAKARSKYIDVFRGFSICAIIFIHAMRWWFTPADNAWFFASERFFIIFAAPAFLFVSGASMTVSKKGPTESHILSLLIFGLGAVATPAWGAWIWDSLVIIGFARIFGYYLRNMKPAALLAIAAIIIIVTPVVNLTDFAFLVGGEGARYNISNFPPFPALAYFIAGMGFFKIEKKWLYLIAIGLFSILIPIGFSSILIEAWIGGAITVIVLATTFILFKIFSPKSETIEIFGISSLTGYFMQEGTVYLFGWHTWPLFMLILLPFYIFALSRVLKLLQKHDLTVERFLRWTTKKILNIKRKKNQEEEKS